MSELTLKPNLYLYPTPSGAYYAVSNPESDKARTFLLRLLQEQQTPPLTEQHLMRITNSSDAAQALALLQQCQKLGWVQALKQPLTAPTEPLDDLLPTLLKPLSETGKVLLADEQGFYLASAGFPHESAEELSALSADLASVYARRSRLLINNMGVNSQAWGLIDAFGNSQIGFWPLFIGDHRFVVVLSGIAHFNQDQFIRLAWALCIRYIGHPFEFH
jgi:hypothetical protein